MNERESLVALSSFLSFGPVRINLLFNYFGSAKKIWKTTSSDLEKIGLKERTIEAFDRHRAQFDSAAYFERLTKLKITFKTFKDDDYPLQLKNLTGAPSVLYIKGEEKILDEKSIAIIGSRKMTSYGKEVTEIFVSGLVLAGVNIISGLARGIDSAAHRQTLISGGKTIAVLGTGLDCIYPPENTNLAREIIEKGGALISEYPLGYPALPANFVNRNRIISGLSEGVVVIEGAEKSGTLVTASHAADQGKTVFAVPGQITSPMSGAPLFLLKNGAKLATTPTDVLSELGWQNIIEEQIASNSLPADENEAKILEFLENEPLHLDELVRISGQAIGSVSARLSIMELKGLVKNMGRGMYKRKI